METRVLIYRIQDTDGRGPYKPGFSRQWVSKRGPIPPPTWMEEFGTELFDQIKPGEHLGCGCRSMEQINKWFMREEIDRLRLLGYSIVKMRADRILAESKHQIVFARNTPLNLDLLGE